MTVIQRQCLLTYLGYDTGGVDGIWGNRSRKAAEAFQKDYDLAVNGEFGPEEEARIRRAVTEETDDWWADVRYFAPSEFACKCGGKFCDGFPAAMQKTAVRLADRARAHFAAPATVVSGLRCKEHNANEGGVENSQHLYGEAVDLRIRGVSSAELLAYIRKQPEVRYAYAINDTNVHFDIPKGKR